MKIVRIRKGIMAMMVGFTILLLTGCVSIKEYQKIYLNDPDMKLADDKVQTFESNFQTYREGVSGANGGKSGGGCGCN